jgi:hypothetical protein
MKNIYYTLIANDFSAKAFACTYFIRVFQILDDLKGYEFIAHVKIVNDHDKEPLTNPKGNSFDKVDIQVQELFKGKMTNVIYEVDKKNFCSLNIVNGKEWIFFAVRLNGKLVVHYCDDNLIIEADGRD